jgi:hypothetical protein
MPGTVTMAGAGLVETPGVAALGWATACSSSIQSAAAVRVDATNAAGRARVMSEFGTVNFSGLTAFDYRMKLEAVLGRYGRGALGCESTGVPRGTSTGSVRTGSVSVSAEKAIVDSAR